MKIKNLHFVDLIRLSLYIYLAVLTLGYAFIGKGTLFDETTFILSAALGGMFIISLKMARYDVFDHIAMISILFLLFIFPRILVYLFSPEMVVLPFAQNIELHTLNQGMLFVSVGTALLLAGIFVADFAFQCKRQATDQQILRTLKHPLTSLSIIFIIIVAIELYGFMWLGVSPYGKLQADTGNTQFQFLKVFFALDTFFFFTLCILVFEKAYSLKTWMAFAIIVFMTYAIYTALSGSRGIGIRLILIFSVIILVGMVNIKLRVSQILVIIVMIALTGLASWKIGTLMRSSIAAEYNCTIFDCGAKIDGAGSNSTDNSNDVTGIGGSKFIYRVLNRMGILDYAIQITAQTGDPIALANYMNFTYSAKSIANSVLPGLPFSEAPLSTSRVLNIIYRGYDEKFVLNSGYFSEYWTVWGISFIFFGWWGGLVALFIVGFVLHIIYSRGAICCGKYSTYYKGFFLFMVTSSVYLSMGIDNSIVTIMTLSLQMITMFVFLSLFNVIIRKIV